MTANAGYHAYATGDVLTAAQVQYNLQNQTVMYFATTTARDAALTGAILVEGMVSYTPATGVMYYNGTAWTAVGSSSPLTTKGDLYTYSTTNARLPVGANGTSLVADSSQTTGLGWTATPSASNPVINSAMQVWQRATSFAFNNNNAYTADRWYASVPNTAATISRQNTSDTTNLPNIQYCMRLSRNSATTNTGNIAATQSFETINSIPFAGKTVTLSFYARAGANFSAASSAISVYLVTGTGTDQNQASGYTGQALPINSSATLTTTWQRFTYTGTIAATATEIATQFLFTPVGTAGAADYFEITGVQIDVASVALPFRTFSQTLQGELAACQRYYAKSYPQGTAPATASVGSGIEMISVAAALPTGYSLRNISTPVVMRTSPTVTIYGYAGGAGKVSDGSGADLAASSGIAIYIGDASFFVQNQSGGNITPSYNTFMFHYIANAEL